MLLSSKHRVITLRALFGAITLLCLLWHILLPTMVQVGIVPQLYTMPSHCQPVNIAASSVMMQHHIHEHHHAHHDNLFAHTTEIELSTEAQQIYALAAEIMKHCPLCTHGLEGAVILPIILLISILLLFYFTKIRFIIQSGRIHRYLHPFHYILPVKHAPPITL